MSDPELYRLIGVMFFVIYAVLSVWIVYELGKK